MNNFRRERSKLLQSDLVRNAAWMFAGQGVGFILQAGYFVLLARLLGSAEYGIYSGAFALASLASQYSTLGAGTVFLRYVSSDKSQFAQYWGYILLVVSGMSALVILALQVLSPLALNRESAALMLPAAITICFCTQITFCVGQVFQTYERLKVTATLNLIANLCRFLAALALVLTVHRVNAWTWSMVSLLVSIVAAAAAVIAVYRQFGAPRFVPGLFKRHALEGIGYSFSSSTASAYNDLDKMMLSRFGMNVANGIYSMAYRIVDIATMPIFSIRDAAMPRFFVQGSAGVQAAAALSSRLLKRTLPIAGIAAIAMFVAAPLIPHIVGPDFSASVSALRWLCLIPVFRSVHQMTGSALTGAGLQRYRTGTQVTAALGNFGLNIWLIPAFGWLGAAWASLLTDGALGLLNGIVLIALSRARSSPAVPRITDGVTLQTG